MKNQLHEGSLGYVINDRNEAVITADPAFAAAGLKEYTFPGEVNGYRVVGIQGDFCSETVERILLSEGIEWIGERAIHHCKNLKEAVLPSTLKDLGKCSFIECPDLTKLSIAEENAYLIQVENAIYTKDKETLIKYLPKEYQVSYYIKAPVKRIAAGAFCNTQGILEITTADSIAEIDAYAFAYADVEEIFFENESIAIAAHAFENSGLQRIRIPQNTKEIGDRAFADCRQLQWAILPSEWHTRKDAIFQGCTRLQNICETEKDLMHIKDRMYRSSMQEYRQAKESDVITFGLLCEGRAKDVKYPIEWRVVRREDNKLLVTAEKTVELAPESLAEALCEEEKACILESVYDLQERRPVMWIDLERVEQYMPQTNEEYIREWYLQNNDYLMLRDDREEMLDVLTLFTVLYENMAGISERDVLVKEGNHIRIVSGPMKTNDEVIHILKTINYEYGYLQLSDIKLQSIYRYLHSEYTMGRLSDRLLRVYAEDWYLKLAQHYRNCQFDRIVYVIKDKVFYADQLLTGEEIDCIEKYERGDQIQYDVDHHNGTIHWW